MMLNPPRMKNARKMHKVIMKKIYLKNEEEASDKNVQYNIGNTVAPAETTRIHKT